MRNTVVLRWPVALDARSVSPTQPRRSPDSRSEKKKVEEAMAIQTPNPSDLISATTQPETIAAKRTEPTHIPTKNQAAL
ncbi:MAG: hypothetical protein A4E39_02038 [Methanoregulaceae archaeon PtaB.Bin152]|nr:MAG: hypothetical protein A4E39_02038 [Methanoregulaceae archaeon PtaB.Bin152]